ncbi:hypothetical protein [Candidatus Mycoplasma haematominutum]|uniref:hypothetical protein n=1 Tax=Candidatus Mycoplasma haematominutum TaxID=209446 RepID=UPI000694442C|nr:hypothetical protein [Candidatus Mycoplasma haematominutum]
MNLFYERTYATPTAVYVFWNIWNHFVTLIAFLNLLSYRYNSYRRERFFSKTRSLLKYLTYWVVNALANIYFCIDQSQALPYGAIANWSWVRTDNLSVASADNGQNAPIVYNFQLAFFSFLAVWITTVLFFLLFWAFFESKHKYNRDTEEIKAIRPWTLAIN